MVRVKLITFVVLVAWNTGTAQTVAHDDNAVPIGGTNNTGYGKNALISMPAIQYVGGDLNSAVGYECMKTNFSGDENTAAGAQALYSNYNNNWNTAVGAWALYAADATENVGIGSRSMYGN